MAGKRTTSSPTAPGRPTRSRAQGRSRRFRSSAVRVIESMLEDGPTLVAVAAAMSLHVRTLQRRLMESDTTFRELLDECRRKKAKEDLEKGQLSIGEISSRLGYSHPAHFARAFKRWTGHSATRDTRTSSHTEGDED